VKDSAETKVIRQTHRADDIGQEPRAKVVLGNFVEANKAWSSDNKNKEKQKR
jgi:hypothetical protein